MNILYILLITSILFNIILIELNRYKDNENKDLKWNIKSKDSQIDHRNQLIGMYGEQVGTLKKIIQSDTNKINRLERELKEAERW